MRPANERQRYNVKSSLIDWAHSQYDPWQNNWLLAIAKGDIDKWLNQSLNLWTDWTSNTANEMLHNICLAC